MECCDNNFDGLPECPSKRFERLWRREPDPAPLLPGVIRRHSHVHGGDEIGNGESCLQAERSEIGDITVEVN